jgi:hypothetical protein
LFPSGHELLSPFAGHAKRRRMCALAARALVLAPTRHTTVSTTNPDLKRLPHT